MLTYHLVRTLRSDEVGNPIAGRGCAPREIHGIKGYPCALLGLFLGLAVGANPARATDNLVDMAGAVTPLVKPLAQDAMANEVRYEVRLRNETTDPIPAHSLLLVLDRVSTRAGDDRDPYKGDRLIEHIEILNKDGTTPDGHAFFQLPISQGADLLPNSISEPIVVRLQTPDYIPIFPPVFRILGERRPSTSASLDVLIQLLIEKGVLTRGEWESSVTRWRHNR